MFSYYGSKASIVNYYPKPKHDTIIEPFAGSARYSLKYHDKNVIISDKNEDLYRIWKYLQACSEKDILGLPKLKAGDFISKHKYLSANERMFLSFMANAGSASGSDKVSKFVGDIEPGLRNVAASLYKIKHWVILNKTYYEIPNQVATWYIDPPYQYGGEHYTCSSKQISFPLLAKWCKEREGQVMVCENTKANWLPFKALMSNSGLVHTTTEALWCNEEWSPMLEQIKLF